MQVVQKESKVILFFLIEQFRVWSSNCLNKNTLKCKKNKIGHKWKRINMKISNIHILESITLDH